MKPILTSVLVAISIAYPTLVYWGGQSLNMQLLALVILGVGLLKFLATPEKFTRWPIIFLLVTLGYSLWLLVDTNEYLLRLYPVIISSSVAIMFALSLRQQENVIERIARMSGKIITPRAKQYTFKLTLIWTLLLLLNSAVALYFAHFGTLEQWALYCGLISYLCFGGFFILELIYRHFYILRYGH